MRKSELLILTQSKSTGVALALALFFGPIGLLYADVSLALKTMVACFVAVMLGFLTGGIGWILLPVIYVYSFIAAVDKVNSHNTMLLEGMSDE